MIPRFLDPGAPPAARPLVKICGVRRPEDVRAAVEAGADAIGFNLWPGSKRYVAAAEVAGLVKLLPSRVAAVAVTVGFSRAELVEAVRVSGVQAVQLHGDEPLELARGLGVPVVKALRVSSEGDVEAGAAWLAAGAVAVLLDAPSAGFGGAGVVFDWDLARRAVAKGMKIVLAGGLREENVGEAVRVVRPWAVDVASGVESAPGVKDEGKMRAFVAGARGAAHPPLHRERDV
ncbi:MAG: phosphoribosylanthranilate isomerase [Anaeromyxobacteraceae bacterium]